MQTQDSPWLPKITLLVLLAILACLVVVIAHNRQRSVETTSDQAAVDETAPVAAEPTELADAASGPVAPAPVHLSSPKRPTNIVVRTANPTPIRVLTQPVVVTVVEPTTPPTASIDPPYPEGAVVGSGLAGTTAPAVAGGLTGRVTLLGAPPSEIPIDLGPICGTVHPEPATTRHYVTSSDGGLANVLVYIKSGLENGRFAVTTSPPVLDNVGCLFEPYVFAIQVGQRFTIRNSDPTLHNVHARPKINQEFNFAMPLQRQETQKSFPNPELFVRINCDVHPWMFAYVSVLPHPFFAVSDEAGNYRLPPGLPPGKYVLAARHQKAGELEQPFTLRGNELSPINFRFQIPARLSRL